MRDEQDSKNLVGHKASFIVRVTSRQNATWQGTVTWTDGQRTQPFRSALELIRLIDSALLEQAATEESKQPEQD